MLMNPLLHLFQTSIGFRLNPSSIVTNRQRNTACLPMVGTEPLSVKMCAAYAFDIFMNIVFKAIASSR
jgi:hypothetical protein